jgi:WD40 repeat protein
VNKAFIYDLKFNLLNSLAINGTAYAIQFVTNNQLAIPWYNNSIYIINWQSNSINQTLTEHSGKINAMQLISNQYLASCSDDTFILIWNFTSGQVYRNLSGHTDNVYSIQVLANTSQLASASKDGMIKIWAWQSSTCIKNLTASGIYPTVLQLLTDFSLAVGFSDFTIRTYNILNTSNIYQIKNLTGHTGLVTAIQNISTTSIASASLDGTILLWSLSTNSIVNTTLVNSSGLYFLSLTQQYLISGYSNMRAYLSTVLTSYKNVTTGVAIYSSSIIAFTTG